MIETSKSIKETATSSGRIAFILERNIYLKFYLPVIDALLAREVAVDVWYIARPAGQLGVKTYQLVVRDELPARLRSRCHLAAYESESDLIRLVKERHIAVVVSLRPKYQVLPSQRGKLNCRFITLQHGLDSFLPVTTDVAYYADELLLYTDAWARVGENVFGAKGDRFRAAYRKHVLPRTKVVGWPGLDGLATSYDIRGKLGLPANRRVVLLLPIGVLDNSVMTAKTLAGLQLFVAKNRVDQLATMAKNGRFGPWISVLNGWSEHRMIKCLREFCARNHAILIAKGREKDPFRRSVADGADYCFFDTPDFDPPILLELLRISDLVVHFDSTAALEAVAAGVPAVSVEMPGRTAADLRNMGDEVFFNHDIDGPFNYPGVNQYWSLERFYKDFPCSKLDGFKMDPARRRSYLSQWAGPIDGRSGQRAADAILAHLRNAMPIAQA